MMFEFVVNWLNNRSLSMQRVGNELRFMHSRSQSSLLVLKDHWHDDQIPVRSDLLKGLFDSCLAASIGNGHIIIGSTLRGGIDVSHGYRIPDLEQMRLQAENLGMTNVSDLEVFMTEASWMFLYGVDPTNDRLIRFDRDFDTYESLSSIESVLNDWWKVSISL